MLQHLPIVNCAAMNIGVHRFFWIDVFGFLGYNPSSGIAGSKGSFTYTMEFYAASRKKELLPFASAWMQLESIMLSEVSPKGKDKYHRISPINGT